MHILEWPFKILTICGCWRPPSWSAASKRILYNVYTILVITLISTFTFSQLMDILLNVENLDDFTNNFYELLAMFISCCKMSTLLTSRRNIGIFIHILQEEPFAPTNREEIEIRRRFDQISGKNTIRYTTLVESTILCKAITSLIVNYGNGILTFQAWLPYDYSSSILFSVTYFHQLLGWMVGSLLHVACDSLICGLLIHTCSQIEVLECRLKHIKQLNEDMLLKKCARHHDRIYTFAGMVNREFNLMIFIQFLVSTLVVCCSMYELVKVGGGPKCLQIILYMSCMLTQIFFYCWYGNEVKLKSHEVIHTIFGTNWTTLDINSKRILLMIIRRATVPIEFTTAYFVPMNLDSFVNLIKTSYSVYTVLQQAQE